MRGRFPFQAAGAVGPAAFEGNALDLPTLASLIVVWADSQGVEDAQFDPLVGHGPLDAKEFGGLFNREEVVRRGESEADLV